MNAAAASTPSCSSGGSPPTGAGPPRVPRSGCRVPSCTQALGAAYNRKHRICKAHHRAGSWTDAGGVRWRFCSQCAKVQPLDCFDGDRRSCRDSLVHHKERRRLEHAQLMAQRAAQQEETQAALLQAGRAKRQRRPTALPGQLVGVAAEAAAATTAAEAAAAAAAAAAATAAGASAESSQSEEAQGSSYDPPSPQQRLQKAAPAIAALPAAAAAPPLHLLQAQPQAGRGATPPAPVSTPRRQPSKYKLVPASAHYSEPSFLASASLLSPHAIVRSLLAPTPSSASAASATAAVPPRLAPAAAAHFVGAKAAAAGSAAAAAAAPATVPPATLQLPAAWLRQQQPAAAEGHQPPVALATMGPWLQARQVVQALNLLESDLLLAHTCGADSGGLLQDVPTEEELQAMAAELSAELSAEIGGWPDGTWGGGCSWLQPLVSAPPTLSTTPQQQQPCMPEDGRVLPPGAGMQLQTLQQQQQQAQQEQAAAVAACGGGPHRLSAAAEVAATYVPRWQPSATTLAVQASLAASSRGGSTAAVLPAASPAAHGPNPFFPAGSPGAMAVAQRWHSGGQSAAWNVAAAPAIAAVPTPPQGLAGMPRHRPASPTAANVAAAVPLLSPPTSKGAVCIPSLLSGPTSLSLTDVGAPACNDDDSCLHDLLRMGSPPHSSLLLSGLFDGPGTLPF